MQRSRRAGERGRGLRGTRAGMVAASAVLATSVFALGGALLLAGGALSATPASGTVTLQGSLAWTGGPFVASNAVGCQGAGDPTCDNFLLTVDKPDSGTYKVEITVSTANTRDDFDVFVYGPDGMLVDDATSMGTPPERVLIPNAVEGTYRVEVQPFVARPGITTYQALAVMKRAVSSQGSPDPNSVLWGYDPDGAEASAEVPLRIVLVGFKPGDLSLAQVNQLTSSIPNNQRPGVLIPRYDSNAGSADRCSPALGGNWTLINHGRCYYDSTRPFLVPWSFNWKPQVVYAPDAFADGLFATMKANSSKGDLSGAVYREHLERYNATRGIYRDDPATPLPDRQVLPGSQMRFVDAEKAEDWIAANTQKYFGWQLNGYVAKKQQKGSPPGFAIFVLNTWDSPAAVRNLAPQSEYHAFKVVRIDPDTGNDEGIDWARVWGGRYREMILDLGAAPNPYESETWGNRGRAIFGSESFDPPLWEYRANAPRPLTLADLPDAERYGSAVSPGRTWTGDDLAFNIGRFANEAASYRFAHSYLYEPRPQTGNYYLSSSIWHDANAAAPWPSDSSRLYNEQAVFDGLRTLVPYFSFAGDTEFRNLPIGDPDQAMIDDAKLKGDDLTGVPGTGMYTVTAMDYMDADRQRFYRGGSCATTIPNLNVVVEKHYAWYLPLITAGVATNRSGVPWGFLGSVNDLTKWSGGDSPDAVLHAVHPDVFSGTFSYTAIHELSHYLGLAHPHDTIGASKAPDGTTKYWDGFTWTFNSTAAPTTYSHDELTYSILDQENISRGHTAYYLRWTNEALAEGGEVFAENGSATLTQLSAAARRFRSDAISSMATARTLFAKFQFVDATFAAQTAWRNAARFRDLAYGLPAGSSELLQGTKLAGASNCGSASIPG